MELESLAVKLEEENDRLIKEKVILSLSFPRFLLFINHSKWIDHNFGLTIAVTK